MCYFSPADRLPASDLANSQTILGTFSVSFLFLTDSILSVCSGEPRVYLARAKCVFVISLIAQFEGFQTRADRRQASVRRKVSANEEMDKCKRTYIPQISM